MYCSLLTKTILNDSLVQVLEEGIQRAIGDAAPDGIIGDGNRTCEVSFGIVGQKRAVSFVGDMNLTDGVDRTAGAVALYLKDKQSWLALSDVDDYTIWSLETWQRGRDVGFDTVSINILDRIATGNTCL